MEFIKPDININFVGVRKYAYALSLGLIIIGMAAVVWHGSSLYGIDFAGGTLIQVKFNSPTNAGKIREGLKAIGLDHSAIQSFGNQGENTFLIRADVSKSELRNFGQAVKDSLEGVYGKGTVDVERVEMVGPKVGKDLRQKALLAIYYATLFMAIYISGRFELRWTPALIMAGVLILCIYVLRALGMGISMLTLAALVVTIGLCWVLRLKFALGAIP
jgi:preprotein translocase subunit SecF